MHTTSASSSAWAGHGCTLTRTQLSSRREPKLKQAQQNKMAASVQYSMSGGKSLIETKRASMIVAAIDFGTTYSGCAYSFRSEWEKDPLKIYSNNFLTRPDSSQDGSPNHSQQSQYPTNESITPRQTSQVPTAILFNPQEEFVAFGYEAENIYAQMCEDNAKEAKRWYYFYQFKMNLHSKENLDRGLKLLDFTQRKGLPAIKVFSEGIRYLRRHVLAADKNIREEDVEWVLTVPAIWSDKARQFMREAAREAGIPDERLSLALEPEAASVLCLEDDRRQDHLGIHQPGSRFMVVDNGGGTVDITVYEVMEPGKETKARNPPRGSEPRNVGVKGVLKELHRPTGGPFAGTGVDKAFKKFLGDSAGFDAIAALDKLETLEIAREFEDTKKLHDSDGNYFIKLPQSAAEGLKEALDQNLSDTRESVSIMRNRMKIKKSVFEGLFEGTIQGVIKHVDLVLEKVGKVDTILLVGGFSGCSHLQKSIKEHVPGTKVLIPPDPAAAVLKGAVLYRHDPSVIGWRASAFTYGIEADEPFEEGRHREDKAHFEGTEKRSRQVFARFIKVNDIVEVDQLAKSEIFIPCDDGQKKLVLPIYKSTEEDPVHTTDKGCDKLGEVSVDLQNVRDPKEVEVLVEMYVGGTELIIRARNNKTEEEYSTVCDFLCK